MANGNFFKVLKKDKKTRARVGEITTPHGKILTPAFVPVGSQASVKSLTPKDLKEIGIQVFFVNTYHLYLRPGAEVIQKLGGLHKFMGWDGPIMTDSGGFQIFSLKRSDLRRGRTSQEEPAPSLVKIDDEGVTFKSHWDGSVHRFTPEKSIEVQKMLGGDLMVAFDECTPYPTTKEYARVAMERTHRWVLRCLEATPKVLFGVIQGSVYKDLREKSAKFISSLPFAGIAIGGVSVGETKERMRQVLDWVMPCLQKTRQLAGRPVHLLGVGEIDDIFEAVERGVDMMDCVMPTRLGRMGWILTKNQKSKIKNQKFKYDVIKSEFVDDKSPPDPDCRCFVCQNFSRAYLNHLFRVRELLAYRLATFHNLYFMERLFQKIREGIKNGEFDKLKKQWLKQ